MFLFSREVFVVVIIVMVVAVIVESLDHPWS
jgi:hypothetical protein